eukprot:TRINITY_DN18298_c0_g1_i1.p1 TRINITY_DN18298_c0_g1~~TRINITY_DN18298_c0_g1_i1.p1  ORF type:complete len:344 (-),score=144.75 TRINITY_DN18298_c0_g1_i1:162-1193(-)
MARTAKGWVLTSRPTDGPLTEEYFDFKEFELPALEEGDFLLKVEQVSLDPTHRLWAIDSPEIGSYMPPAPLGQPMRAGVVGVVEESKNAGFPVGATVSAFGSWASHHVVPKAMAAQAQVLDVPEGADKSLYLALVSFIGLTAYYGLTILKPEEGKTFVVDGAAGAVGSLILQMMKYQGKCKCIAIAGSDEKCAWTKELGADHAINYKTENVADKLKEYAPEGIDYCFENVGGQIFSDILANMNNFGRVALCGLISQYTSGGRVSQDNFQMVLMKRLTVRGFICTDYYTEHAEQAKQFGPDVIKWHSEGHLQFRVDKQHGLENIVKHYDRLRTGKNIGKLVVEL